MTPSQRLVAAANVLDQPDSPTDLVHGDARPLVAAILLLRGLKLAPFPAPTQVFLCEREPSREALKLADLVLDGAA